MKNKTNIASPCLALVATCALFGASAAQASVTYGISVDTSALTSLSAFSPFALDFQYNGGETGNTVTVSNLNYGIGGSFTNSPAASSFGAVVGDLSTGNIVLGNTSVNTYTFNEFFQGFTPGNLLSFDVTFASTTPTPNPTPDTFFFGILDKDLLSITTNGLGDTLGSISIGSIVSFTANSGTGAYAGVISAVPEPSTNLGLLALGVAALHVRRRAK